MSDLMAASAVIATIKNVFDILGGVNADRAELFEKVVRPMHSEAQEVVTGYYRFFHFIQTELCKPDKHVFNRESYFAPLGVDAFQQIEAAYSEGKAQRDAVRSLAKSLYDGGKPKFIMSYCAAVERIFVPLVDFNEGKMSAARRMVDIAKVCSQQGFSPAEFNFLASKQIGLIEDRWVAACQTYGTICLRAYRR